jgi:hypothetical protein
MIRSINRPTPLARKLLEQRMLVAITLLLTYGGGLWLWLLHEADGATEKNAPPRAIQWLRDSTLSLPLVALGVVLGAMLARRFLARYGRTASGAVSAAVVAVVLALYASAVFCRRLRCALVTGGFGHRDSGSPGTSSAVSRSKLISALSALRYCNLSAGCGSHEAGWLNRESAEYVLSLISAPWPKAMFMTNVTRTPTGDW